MKRTAFTLMELLISVVLVALLALFLYGALGGSRATNLTMKTHADAEAERLKQYALLYRDCVESYTFAASPTNDKHYQFLQMQTQNSLYDIAAPYVTYYVHAETLKLIRLESALPINLPVSYDDRMHIHADVIATDVTDFNIYTAKKKETADTNASNTQSGGSSTSGTTEGATAMGGERAISTHLLYLKRKGTQQPLLMELAF